MTNLYDQQQRNLRRSAALLTGFILFLAFLGIGADGLLYTAGASPGIPVMTLGAILFGAGSAWWCLRDGDRAVLQSTNARPLDPSQPRERVLDNVVEEMAIASGLPKPAIFIVPDPDPNAFATGSGPQKSSIAVTAGLLETLNREELQGVVSHEMSHVRNYDVRVMTIVAALVGSVLLISDWGRRGLYWGGGARRNDDREGGSGALADRLLRALGSVDRPGAVHRPDRGDVGLPRARIPRGRLGRGADAQPARPRIRAGEDRRRRGADALDQAGRRPPLHRRSPRPCLERAGGSVLESLRDPSADRETDRDSEGDGIRGAGRAAVISCQYSWMASN